MVAKQVFAAPVHITDVTSKKQIDNHTATTLKVVTAREATPEEMTALFQLIKGDAYMVIALSQAVALYQKIPEFIPEFKGEKSPSQRLKAVIYRLWEKNGSKGDSESFYRSTMEKLIESLKERLD